MMSDAIRKQPTQADVDAMVAILCKEAPPASDKDATRLDLREREYAWWHLREWGYGVNGRPMNRSK